MAVEIYSPKSLGLSNCKAWPRRGNRTGEPEGGIEDQRGATIFGETRDWLELSVAASPIQRSRRYRPILEPSLLAAPLSRRLFIWGLDVREKSKGCDIGYALAASSCEEANSVDACTVTALDATTAFAVPNPNCPSQSQSVFSGLVARPVALLS